MPTKKTIRKSALAPTVLIAGGAGFIGSHLAETFLTKGARVVIIDTLTPEKERYIESLIRNPKFALFNVDVNFEIPEEINSVDYVINLAGLEEYLFDKTTQSLDDMITNSWGTKNLLDLTQKSEGKFVLVSTIDVCANEKSQFDLKEYFGHSSTNEKKFTTIDSRKFAETLVWEHQKKHGTDVRIVRLPEIYGPNMSLESSSSLGGFIKDLIQHKDLTIYGNENKKEYYLYILDAVSGIIKSLFNQNTVGNTYNLVSEDAQKVLTIAFLLRNLADRRTEVKFKPTARELKLEISDIDTFSSKKLGWQSKTDFKTGIAKTLQSFGYSTNSYSFKATDLVMQKSYEDSVKKGEALYSLETTETDTLKKKNLQKANMLGTEIDEEYVEDASQYNINGNINFFTKAQRILVETADTLIKPVTNFLHLNKVATLFGKSPVAVLSTIAIVIAAVVIFIVMPVISLKNNTEAGVKSLQNVYNYSTQLDNAKAISEAENSYKKLEEANKSYRKVKWLAGIFLGRTNADSISRLLNSATLFSRSIYSTSQAIEPYSKLWEIIRPESNLIFNENLFYESKSQIDTAINYMQLAQADFKYVDKEKLPNFIKSRIDEYEKGLKSLSDNLELLSGISTELPNTLGVDKPKRYLVLFQNSNELRPTGGFIGSYGLVEINKGKITNLLIDDIYNPDGQIDLRNIRVAAPKPIVDFLAEDRQHLRNANWNPDFPQTSQEFADLYFKVTGQKLDGVLAIDLSFVQDLLKVTGPIYLASYNEEITAENLYERAQFHSDFDYKDNPAGASQKKTFLTTLGGKLIERLFSLPKDKISGLFASLNTSLAQKHILIYLSNNSINSVLNKKGWDGSLVNTAGDYLYIVNANLGGTKSNYYVQNSYAYTVNSKTRDGLLRGTLELNYAHTGKDMSWPGGPYTDYLRVLTQKGSKLTGAKLITDNVTQTDIFDKVITSTVGQYTSFEIPFILQPNSSLKIVLDYDLPETLNITKEFKDYSLIWQKQPGTQNDNVIFTFNPPFGMTLEKVWANTELKKSESPSFESILDVDKKLFVQLK